MQEKKGISLIVLVITIIVMIVLAGAIILSLNNAGIIGKANEAVKDTDEATIKELAQMAWGEAYAEGIRHVETIKNEDGTETQGLEARVKEALRGNNVKLNDYGIAVTTKGVTVKKGWLKNGFEVVKGEQKLAIGSSYNYDAGVESYTGGWKVLGADEEGNLLILSSTKVGELTLGDNTGTKSLGEFQQEWWNTPMVLDEKCYAYGKGEGAIGARSITIEDVDSVTGYDKLQYNKGQLKQYGNEITFMYNSDQSLYPAYDSTVTGSGMLINSHKKGFNYHDGNKFGVADLAKGVSGEKIVTLKLNYYYYKAADLNTIDEVENKQAYTMLFSNNSINYWLASRYVGIEENVVFYGIRSVVSGAVSDKSLWNSAGYSKQETKTRNVRAVVTISK